MVDHAAGPAELFRYPSLVLATGVGPDLRRGYDLYCSSALIEIDKIVGEIVPIWICGFDQTDLP